jgi:hypothetical protein
MSPITPLLLAAAFAALLLSSCNEQKHKTSDSQGPAASLVSPQSLPNNGPPRLEATRDGRLWEAASIHYHVDQAFESKEYAHVLEARAADGSKLDMVILCAELTLSPRPYPSSKTEEVNITYTPAGRSAGSFGGDSTHDAQVTIASERQANKLDGAFSATLQDHNPNGHAVRLEGSFSAIPRAKP